MIDVLYLILTIGFFALMLWYIRGCEALGRDSDHAEERNQ
jgi:hypothetical protein